MEDKELELFENKVLWRIEDLVTNLPAITRGVGDVQGEAIAIRELVKNLSRKYELTVDLYEQQIKELEEKIKELEGDKDNE